MKKKFATAYGGLILLLCASSGILAGFIGGNGGGKTSVVDTDDETIKNTYIDIPTKKVDEFLSDDSSNSYKNVLYATNTVFAKSSKYITSASTGTVTASVAGIPYNQSIATKRIINDQDTFFQTNTISSFVKKSEQRYTNSNSYLVRQGSNPTLEGADYSSSKVEALSKKDYMNRYGHTNRDIFNYAINDYSFASGTYEGKKDDGLYYFTYTLEPDIATAGYVREVAYMAGSSSYPVFSKISFTIAIDENYRIFKSTTNENYTTPILGGINCDGTSNETYQYYTSSVDCPEKAAFEPYFGKETGEITKDKTAMDYLSQLGDDMSQFNNLQLKGNVKLNEEELALKLKLDLQNNAYYVDIDDKLDVIYTSSNAYVLTDKSSFLVKKEELNSVLKIVAGEQDLFDASTLMNLMNDPFVSKILDTMTVSKVDSYVDINIPFTDDSKVVLHLYEQENEDKSTTVSIKGVEANLKYETYDLSAKLDVVENEDLTFKQIPETITEINNISPIASKIKEIVDKKAFYGQINYAENLTVNSQKLPVSLSGLYYVDLKDENNPIYKFELKVNINSQDINVIIDGCKDDFYVQIGDNFKAYTTYNDLINLINKYVTLEVNIPTISIKQVFNSLVDVIDNLDFYKDYIEFNLDYLNINYLNGKIKISHKQDLTLSYNDNLSISLLPFDGTLTKVSYNNAIKLTDVVNAINPYLNGNYNVTFNNFEYQGVLVNGNVNLQADFNDIENSSISGKVSVTYKDITANVEFYYVNKTLYVTLNDNTKIYLSLADVKELLNQFIPDFSVELPSVDLSKLDILTIINSISTTSSSIKVDLSNITSSKFNYDLVINLENNQTSLIEQGSNNNQINLLACDKTTYTFDKDQYTNAKVIVDSLLNLFNKVKNQDISTEFSSDITYKGTTYPIKGILSYKKVDNSYQASIVITSPITLKVIYTGSEFYIEVESSYIKFDKASLTNVIDQISKTYNLNEKTVNLINTILDSGLDTYLSKLNDLTSLIKNSNLTSTNIALNVNTLFNYINTKNGKVSISVNLAAFTNLVSSVELVIDENSKIESISTSSINVSGVTIANTKVFNIATSAQASINSQATYLDLSSLVNFKSLKEINDLINNKVYSINVGETTISGVSISGQISYLDISKLDLSILSKESIKIVDVINMITLSGEFTIKLSSLDTSIRVQVNVNNGNIQIKLLDNTSGLTFGGTYLDLVEVLNSVKTDLATSLKAFIKNLDLSNIALPLVITSKASKLDINSVISLVKKYSINTFVKSVTCDKEGKLDLQLDLTSLNINGLTKVGVSYNNSNLSVNIASLTTISLTSATKVDDFETSYGIKTTCTFAALKNLVSTISGYLKGNVNLTFNNFEYQGVLVNGNVNLQADFNDIENSSISGKVSVTYKDITANVEFYYVNKTLYVTLNDNTKIYLSLADVKELLNQFIPDFSVELPSVDLSKLDILTIINSISTTSSSIKVDLSNITSSKFNYDLVINLENNQTSLIEQGSNNNQINLLACDKTTYTFDKDQYTNAKVIVDSLLNLFNKVKNQDISTEFSSDITYKGTTYPIKGILSYKKVDNSYQASIVITSPITLKVIYTGSEFYIEVESSYIKFDKASLTNVIDQISKTYNLNEKTVNLINTILDSGLDTYLSKLNDLTSLIKNSNLTSTNIALNVNTLFNYINTKNGKVSISVNLAAFTNLVSSVELVIDENSKIESISTSSINVSGVTIANTKVFNIATSAQASINSQATYLDLSSLVNFKSLKEINDLINNKVYSINVGETTISGVSISGQISYLDISKLDLSILSKESIKIVDVINMITLSGEFTIKLSSLDTSIRVQVNVNNGNIQIKLLDNTSGLTFGGTYLDLVEVLNSVKTDLATSLKAFIKNLDLSNIALPLVITSKASKLDINSVISLVKKYSINTFVKSVTCDKEGKLDLQLDLTSLNINGLTKVGVSYNNSNLSVNIASLTTISLTSATKVDDFETSYGIKTTCTFAALKNLVSSAAKLLNSRVFSGTLNLTNVNITLKVKDLYSILGLDTSSIKDKDDTIKLGSNVSINYQIDLDNKFNFYLDIAFNVNNVVSDTSKGGSINLKAEHLIVSKVGSDIYFKLSNIVSMLTYDEWIDVIKYFVSELGANLNINYNSIKTTLDQLSKGLDSYITYLYNSSSSSDSSSSINILDLFDINSIINSLSYTSIDKENEDDEDYGKLYVRIPLNKIVNKYNIDFINLSNVGITYNTKEGQVLLTESIDGSINYINVDTSSIGKIDATNYVTATSLKSVIDELVAIKSTLSQKQFVISSSSDSDSNYVSKDGKKLFDYSGKVVVDLTDKLKFTANNVTINSYSYDSNGKSSTSTHNFTLTYLPSYVNNGQTIEKDSFFINYGPNLKGYLSRVEFASLAQYGCDIMGINNPIIKGLLTNLGSAGSLDTDVFSGITSGMSMPNFDINLDNLFDSYSISKDDNGSSFALTLNAIDFYKSLYGEDFNKDNTDPNKNKVTLQVNSNSSRTSVSKLKLANMYSSKQEVFNIDLDINNSISEDEAKLLNIIDVTNTNNELGKYYYIGNLPTLLKAFVNTANLERYHVSGKFSMKIIGITLSDIGYDIKIVLDEDKHPYIEVTFNVSKLRIWPITYIDGGQSKLLYSPVENRFYLRNNKSGKNRTYSYSDSNASDYIGKSSNIAEIIKIILNSPLNSINNEIEDSVSNTSTNININTVLKNYSYTYDESTKTGTTSATLDGSQFMSSLSNLNIHLTNKELDMQIDSSTTKHGDYLTDFTFDTMMSVISINGSGSFKNSSGITSNISVDMNLLNKAISNPNGWSF